MDARDLRRRSPNPDSTTGFASRISPRGQPSEYLTSPSFERRARCAIPEQASKCHPKRVPTIRLVQPARREEHPYGSLPIPPLIRSKSDDGPRTATSPGLLRLLSTTLRRNETAPSPRLYPSRYTWRESQTPFDTQAFDQHRLTPPLDKHKQSIPSPTLNPTSYATALGAAHSIKSAASSLFSIRNPFRRQVAAHGPLGGADEVTSGETTSLHAPSMKSKWSAQSFNIVPMSRTNSQATMLDGKPLKISLSNSTRYTGDKDDPVPKGRVGPACLTHLGKFPFVGPGPPGSGWTIFKWILLVSVISVSDSSLSLVLQFALNSCSVPGSYLHTASAA